MDYKKKYIDLLLTVSLHLQEGEGLSINTSERNLEFAQELAQEASEITKVPVSIVLVEEGVVKDVFSITPIMNELVAETSLQKVLLRLTDVEIGNDLSTYDVKTIAQNPPLLQQAGNLGPPQLNKEIAPFALAAVPNKLWADELFDNQPDSLERLWSLFASRLFLDVENSAEAWINHLGNMGNLVRFIHRTEAEELHLYDEHTNLHLKVVEQSRFRHRLSLLDNKRAYIPSLFDRSITMIPDTTFTYGYIQATRPFKLLGQWVEDAKLVFEGGKVVEFDAKSGKEALEVALNIDEGASKVGLISFSSESSDFPSDIHFYGVGALDEAITSTLVLGMGEANHLEALKTYDDEIQLSAETGLNVSHFRGRIPFGSPTLCVDLVDSNQKRIPILINGSFITEKKEI
jgi:aminopeptidase